MKLLSLIICIFFIVPAKAQNETILLKHLHSITSEEVFGYAQTLAGEEFDGRLAGSPGYTKAAEWVANHLKKWGVQPGFKNGSFFQSYPLDYSVVKSVGSFSAKLQGNEGQSILKTYQFPEHYYPGSNSDKGEAEGEIVYVGYGVTAPEYDYNDYDNMDVNGKIVMIEAGNPELPQVPDWEQWAPYAGSSEKMINAQKHGAIGVLFISKIASPGIKHLDKMVYNHIDTSVAEEFFFAAGHDYKQTFEKLKSEKKPQSIAFRHEVKISAETEYHPEGQYANVIGIIPGSDPLLKNEVVMVGAHLDGQGNLGHLFSGALDNASGVADIMGAARALAQLPAPKRTIAFFFIGAEEKGLLGALEYAKAPLFAADKTVCFINLDMVGNGSGLRFGGGDSFPGIYKHFKQANDNYLHRTLQTGFLNKEYKGRPRTDGMALAQNGFRALSLHCSDLEKKLYYHHPADTHETLVPEIMEDVAKWLYLGLYSLANDENLDLTEVEKSVTKEKQ